MYALWKSDWSGYLMALYEISLKIVHFALSRHQARNLKIRIHVMKDNINAVILIPKIWRSDHPCDRSNLRKILRLEISKWIYPHKIAWAVKINFRRPLANLRFYFDRVPFEEIFIFEVIFSYQKTKLFSIPYFNMYSNCFLFLIFDEKSFLPDFKQTTVNVPEYVTSIPRTWLRRKFSQTFFISFWYETIFAQSPQRT